LIWYPLIVSRPLRLQKSTRSAYSCRAAKISSTDKAVLNFSTDFMTRILARPIPTMTTRNPDSNSQSRPFAAHAVCPFSSGCTRLPVQNRHCPTQGSRIIDVVQCGTKNVRKRRRLIAPTLTPAFGEPYSRPNFSAKFIERSVRHGPANGLCE
jgi:hypothetical protein